MPHFEATCAVSMLLFLHMVPLLILLDSTGLIARKGYTDGQQIGILMLLFVIIFSIVILLVPAKRITEMEIDPDLIRKYNARLIIYIILSFFLLFVAMGLAGILRRPDL
jgi:cytochrome bd-type quinol oxidase subunit 2